MPALFARPGAPNSRSFCQWQARPCGRMPRSVDPESQQFQAREEMLEKQRLVL
jgi:hypothetical protein